MTILKRAVILALYCLFVVVLCKFLAFNEDDDDT